MKKLLAVVLAAAFFFSSVVSGFAYTLVNLSDYKTLNNAISPFNTGNYNYVVPICESPNFSSDYNLSFFLNCYDSDTYYVIFKFSDSYSFYCYLIPKSKFLYSGGISCSSGSYYEFQFSYTSSLRSYSLVSSRSIAAKRYVSMQQDSYRWFSSNWSFPTSNSYFFVFSEMKTFTLMDSTEYYPPSDYTLKVNYYYPDNSVASDSVFQTLEVGTEYSIPSPEIEGYTPNISLVTGIMPSNDLTIDVFYQKNFHALIVNYLFNEATPASDPVTQTLAAGDEYSIPSPEIDGYTPSIPVVTGIMPDEDLTINVYYAKSFYPLTVKYQYADGSAASPDVTYQYPSGFIYDIPSPDLEGYQADKLSVSGTMGNEPLEVVVTYSPIPYTLTVNYQYTDGSTAAESHQEQLFIGASYSIPSPVIEGFHPNQTAVTGIMPARDVISTVTYRDDPGGSGGPGPAGPGEGGGPGEGEGGDTGGEGGSGNDPFIPVLPPYSGNDPFIVPGVPGYSGNDPFVVPRMPGYSGYDPFIVRPPPAFYGYDPFKMPEGGGS